MGTITFDTPGEYQWIRPPGVDRVTVEVWGAQGGNNARGAVAAGGGYLQRQLVGLLDGPVTFDVVVGEQGKPGVLGETTAGQPGTGGTIGGGRAGHSGGGSGGGGSWIYASKPGDPSQYIAVGAGGAGGVGGWIDGISVGDPGWGGFGGVGAGLASYSTGMSGADETGDWNGANGPEGGYIGVDGGHGGDLPGTGRDNPGEGGWSASGETGGGGGGGQLGLDGDPEYSGGGGAWYSTTPGSLGSGAGGGGGGGRQVLTWSGVTFDGLILDSSSGTNLGDGKVTLTWADPSDFPEGPTDSLTVDSVGNCADCEVPPADELFVTASLQWVDADGAAVGDPLVTLLRSFSDTLPETLPDLYVSAERQGASAGFTLGETVQLGTEVEIGAPPVGAVELVAILDTPSIAEAGWGLTWEVHDSEVFVCAPVELEAPQLTGGWSADSVALDTQVSFLVLVSGDILDAVLSFTWPAGVRVDQVRRDGVAIPWNFGVLDLGDITDGTVIEILATAVTRGTFTAIAALTSLNGPATLVDVLEVESEPGVIAAGRLVQIEEEDCWIPNLLDNNLLKGDDFSFTLTRGNWDVVAGDAVAAPSRDEVLYEDLNSLKVVGSDDGFILGSARFVAPSRYMGRLQRAGAWVWVPRRMDVTVTITAADATATVQEETSTTIVRAAQWTWVDATLPNIPATGYVELRMLLEFGGGLTGDAVYIASPVLTSPDLLLDNTFTNEIWLRLPEYMRAADPLQLAPQYPLLRFIDVLHVVSGQVEVIWDQIRYIPPDVADNDPGEVRSKLVDPDICCVKFLPWLASLVGAKVRDVNSGFTAWDQLAFQERSTDIPQPLEDWNEWEVEPDRDDDGTEWDEIESFNPISAAQTPYLRWQVKTAVFGLRGGTQNALALAVRRVLRGDRELRILRFVGGDPWRIRIETLTKETPGAIADGITSQEVLRAIDGVVPAGYEVQHFTVPVIEELESETYGGPGVYGGSYVYGSNLR